MVWIFEMAHGLEVWNTSWFGAVKFLVVWRFGMRHGLEVMPRGLEVYA